ncbi:ATP-binding cassette domain-containing protein [Mucilaginibacter myungsuensis]
MGRSNDPVLNNVDLKIFQSQHLAIVGAAGSGKTTLLNAIAGDIQPSKGYILRNFADIPANGNKTFTALVAATHHFRNLSNTTDLYYQQRYNSADSEDALTVEDHLQTIARSAPLDTYWTFERTIDLLNLRCLTQKHLIKLSNGEAKRLMLASALLNGPQLLLLDAPLNGLDADTRANFDQILTQIAATGITIVISTSSSEIPTIVSKVALLANNSITLYNSVDFNANRSITDPLPIQRTDLSGLLDKYPVDPYQHIVNMQNVNIKYGEKQVLSNINWEVRQGQRWALLGPNGAGKSTLLSLINGDNPQAYANDMILFDRKRGTGESIWDIKKRTGFISPELFQYFPGDSSCLHTIESGYYDTMGLFRPSDPKKVIQALAWMRLLGIEKYARHLLKNIPTSAQRLCLLARAMIKCPTLLILDEPTQGMDATQVAHFKGLIDTICRDTNITIVYVTHYQEHLPDSIDHILKLAEGKVIECH